MSQFIRGKKTFPVQSPTRRKSSCIQSLARSSGRFKQASTWTLKFWIRSALSLCLQFHGQTGERACPPCNVNKSGSISQKDCTRSDVEEANEIFLRDKREHAYYLHAKSVIHAFIVNHLGYSSFGGSKNTKDK